MPHHLHIVAIDLAKKVFHLVGSDTAGTILWRKRLTRPALMPFIAQLPPVVIGIEACGGAHYWARRFREHGHEVKLIAVIRKICGHAAHPWSRYVCISRHDASGG